MQSYCTSLTSYKRLLTREVKIGNLLLGAHHPIRVQTMTTTDTMNTMATVEQAIRCIKAGAELVRITAPSKKEAENLKHIKDELRKRGYDTPLVADIHFTPNAAEIAARIVEKVRINPGNYVDKKKFEQIEYTDQEYLDEIDRIRERFVPLLKICKEYGTAMRIGTNHGSLSDRIMSRYGDTAMGMVESAMEFLRIARSEDFHNIVLSMKSSNPQVMVQAYRLLVSQMSSEFGECYPLHLGVTEAGDGEDGRIKSAIGIGTLLEDGIGDTIRVSLTEDPEFEIPVCKHLVDRYQKENRKDPALPFIQSLSFDPYSYVRRNTHHVLNIGSEHAPVVIADYTKVDKITETDLEHIGYRYDSSTDKWNIADAAADFILSEQPLSFNLPGTLRILLPYGRWVHTTDKEKYLPVFSVSEFLSSDKQHSAIANFVMLDCFSEQESLSTIRDVLKEISKENTAVICMSSKNENAVQSVRRMFHEFSELSISNPAILFTESHHHELEETLIHFAVESGALLIDGMGDGVCFTVKQSGSDSGSIINAVNSISFGILQATRTRISKTEYISCPSCGRTLFDLQETTAKIRAVTNHLKGVKIAIMGCIVNGPGEMADADFGYVGSGPGKITLYKGKEVVKRNVNSEVAVEELILLLKENNAWVDAPTV